MSISIFTVTHVPFTPPEDPIYIPLQVGRSLHEDYGYLGDNTGENISAKNPLYSELTGLYWIWKNYAESDYLGLCHYRRYFLNENGNLMTEQDYRNILSHYDVIIARPRSEKYDYQTIYSISHNIHDLEMTGEIIHEYSPEYYAAFQSAIAGHFCYIGNLFVAPRSLFCSYCEWLFSIFSVLEQRIDVTDYDEYHKRVFGFLSEQLLIVWIKQNGLSYYEADFGLSQEKAETISLKQDLQNRLYADDITGAYHLLSSTLEKRPDLLLEMSDFNQELITLEHVLNICRIELEAGLPTLLHFSKEQDILIRHFRLITSILEKIQDGTVNSKELQYLIDCQISHKGVVYILQNFRQFKTPLLLLNQLAIVYADHGSFLTALSFLEEALTIQEKDQTTLSNIVTILQNMGQPEMAKEYQQLLNSSVSGKRIAVFVGGKNQILNYIGEQYASSLEALGHTVFRFDKSDFKTSLENLVIFQQKGLDATIVVNNVGFSMVLQSGESLWDLWNIPCYNIIVDHPMYYHDTLDHAPKNGIVICSDRNHESYIRRFYPTVRRTMFLPTAGEYRKPFDALKPFTERSIDVLFIGAYKFASSFPYNEFATQITKEMIMHPSLTFESILENSLLNKGIHLNDEELKNLIQNTCTLDRNTCALFRAEILRAIVKAGITVTVYGGAFESTDLFEYPNFVFKGQCGFEEGIRLMEDSKIVLNQLAWFKDGSSERIYEAMLQGAVSLTDDSIYLRETFTDMEDIRFYSLERLNELPAIVSSILADAKSTEKLRKKAYDKAIAQHTWLQRADAIIATL